MAEYTIALDAMGGDHAPVEIVKGAVDAAREFGLKIALVGQQDTVEAELSKHGPVPPTISIVHAPEVVAMDEHPAQAARHKRNSSIVIGLRMVKQGEAAAFVSAGNTGAVMAAAIMYIGRIPGIERPALVALMPTGGGVSMLLDIGANADCKPNYLLQFAHLGSAYMERVLGVANPRVAILSIGEEETKGNQLVQETFPLLRNSGLNFIGAVEGKDLPRRVADVIVTDGFTGNVAVKTMEGTAEFIGELIRDAIMSRWYYKLGGLLVQGAFSGLRRRLDWTEYGAGPLLGINGLVFIAHGRSNARAIRSALRTADVATRSGMMEALRASPVAAARSSRPS